MSQTSPSDVATITEQQIADVRMFCGYSVAGDQTSQAYSEPVYSDETMASLNLRYRLQQMTAEEFANLTTYYLTPLYGLLAAIPAIQSDLAVAEAGTFKRNTREFDENIRLYNYMRRSLCNFLGFPPGRDIVGQTRITRG